MSDAFGFGPQKSKARDRLAEFRPDEDDRPDAPVEKLDQLASRHGFDRRDAAVPLDVGMAPRRGRRPTVGPTLPINMKVPVKIADTFIDWCAENRFGYWEGLDELMKIAKIRPRD